MEYADFHSRAGRVAEGIKGVGRYVAPHGRKIDDENHWAAVQGSLELRSYDWQGGTYELLLGETEKTVKMISSDRTTTIIVLPTAKQKKVSGWTTEASVTGKYGINQRGYDLHKKHTASVTGAQLLALAFREDSLLKGEQAPADILKEPLGISRSDEAKVLIRDGKIYHRYEYRHLDFSEHQVFVRSKPGLNTVKTTLRLITEQNEEDRMQVNLKKSQKVDGNVLLYPENGSYPFDCRIEIGGQKVLEAEFEVPERVDVDPMLDEFEKALRQAHSAEAGAG